MARKRTFREYGDALRKAVDDVRGGASVVYAARDNGLSDVAVGAACAYAGVQSEYGRASSCGRGYEAAKMVLDDGATRPAAARAVGVSETAVSLAVKRLRLERAENGGA